MHEEKAGDPFNLVSRPRLVQLRVAPGDARTVRRQVTTALAAAGFQLDQFSTWTAPSGRGEEQSLVARLGVEQVSINVAEELSVSDYLDTRAPTGTMLVQCHFEPSE